MRRMRRLRQNGAFRRLVRETTLSADDLLQPYFVVPGHGIKQEIRSPFQGTTIYPLIAWSKKPGRRTILVFLRFSFSAFPRRRIRMPAQLGLTLPTGLSRKRCEL